MANDMLQQQCEKNMKIADKLETLKWVVFV